MSSVGEVDEPAERVRHLVELVAQQQAIERALQEEVLRLRHDGISWTDIGMPLDLTRQGARQRYRGADVEGRSENR